MATYTTAQLDTIIATLESSLALGTAEIVFEGRKLVYRSVTDLRNAIAYFNGLYPDASDAPVNATPKRRIFIFFGSNGIGY